MRAASSVALALVLVLALETVPCGAYTQSTTSNGLGRRWPAGTVIRFTFNQSFAPNNNNDLTRAAISDALRTLELAMPATGGVRFQDAGATSLNQSGCDLVNLVTFTAPGADDQLPDGVIAEARSFFFQQAGLGECGGQTFEVTPGQIVDVDMLFNTRERFSTVVVEQNAFDIQSIALHEGGHWLGVNHTGILGAVMSPFGDAGTFAVRRLHPDDLAGLRFIHGSVGGAISGRVTAGGAAVLGAHVVASNAATGVATISAVSDQSGNYRITGLPPGSYRLLAEPLDKPVELSNLPSGFASGNASFVTLSLENAVSVGTGEISGVNIQVATPAAMNLERTGILVGSSALVGGTPKAIRRGADVSIVLGGSNLSGTVRFSSPRIVLRGPLRPASGGFQIADVNVAADAAVGTTDLYFPSSSFTGGLIVTVNPQVPSNGIVEGAAFNQGTTAPHFTPGIWITIFGTDLAEQTAQADRIPLPTQLGGVSVRVGNRLAPLNFVSPTQINALVPYEVAGTSAEVFVVAGEFSESAHVPLSLGTSAPRVFGLGGSQGAITVANTFIVAAPAGRFNIGGQSSRPANRGEALSIFCTGLGRLNNAPATGVASPSSPLATTVDPVSVTIGGRAANVLFSGLTPGLVGLYQINAQVPTDVVPGDSVPVVVRVGGGTSNTVTVAVQ